MISIGTNVQFKLFSLLFFTYINTSVIFCFYSFLFELTEKKNYHMQNFFAVLYLSNVELRLILATSFRILPNKVRRMYLLMNIYIKITETCFWTFFTYCAFPFLSSHSVFIFCTKKILKDPHPESQILRSSVQFKRFRMIFQPKQWVLKPLIFDFSKQKSILILLLMQRKAGYRWTKCSWRFPNTRYACTRSPSVSYSSLGISVHLSLYLVFFMCV